MLWILELVAGMFTPLFLTLIFVTSFPTPVFIILLPFSAVILFLLSMSISNAVGLQYRIVDPVLKHLLDYICSW